jgi:hypothetical protein
MKPLRRTVIAASTVAAVFFTMGRAVACNVTAASLDSWQPNQSLPAFTFDIDVAMRMRHFPWLGFHMQGVGRYEPGKSYVVHFTKLPWFAPRQQHDADLSMLDPSLWPTRFIYQEIGEANGNTLFDLRSTEDPTLKSATVGLGPSWCARYVEAAYDDGTTLTMNVRFSDIDGFMLPASLTADINVPSEALSANADFENYSFGSTNQRSRARLIQAGRTRTRWP